MKALALALAGLPQAALSLSCAPIDLQYEFLEAQDSDTRYVIVMGSISLDRNDYGILLSEDGTEEWLYPATFSGASLGRDGFQPGFSTELVVRTCKGEWCVGPPGTSERIYFFEVTDEGYVHYPRICEADRAPSAANVQILEDCIAGRSCVSAY